MSLQVWLPLNGNLNNQGLTNINVINNGATVNASGKIGSCYQFGTAASDITIPKEAMNSFTTEASVCFWIKILTWNTSYATFFQAGPASTAWTAYIFGLLRNNANSTCCFTISNGSSASNASYLTPSLDLNVWYHISLIYKTGHCLIYINGQLYQDYTTSIVPNFSNITTIKLGRCTNGSSYQTNCQMNDFRIYNHALSTKEAEEIAKGLIGHYKLNDAYIENSTFLSSEISNTAYNSSLSKYGYNSDSNLGKTTGFFKGRQCTKVYTLTENQTAQPYVYFSNLFTSDGTNASAYKTLSFDYYTTVPTTTWLNIYKLGSGTGTATWRVFNSDGLKTGSYTNSSNSILVKPNEWNHIEVILNGTTSSNAEWGYCINGPAHTSNNNYYFLYSNIQLEENDHATGYNQNFHSNITYDYSGYNYNGTLNGNFKISNNTAKFNASTIFNGSNNAILIPFNAMLGLTTAAKAIYTVSVWIYKTSIGTKNYQTILGGPSGFELEARNSSGTDPQFVGWNWGKPVAAYSFNEWTMFTFVHTLEDCKIYVNGELKSTGSSANVPIGNYYIGAWSNATGQNFEGQMSDFRIYATALSADQIKELYDTSVSIDKAGNIYAREVVE